MPDMNESSIPSPILPGEETVMGYGSSDEIMGDGYVGDDGGDSGADVTIDNEPKRKPGRPKKVDPGWMSEKESEKWDYDSWITSFDWDQPGMSIKVERISPEMVGTVQTAGTCGVFDNRPLSSVDIQQMYGGGRYHISIIGPRQTSKGPRIMRLSHKPLKIAGDPNLDNLGRVGQGVSAAGVAAQRGGGRQASDNGGSGGENAGMTKILDGALGHLHRQVSAQGQQSSAVVQQVGQQYREAAEMKSAAADRMMAEKDKLVAAELRSAQQRVDEARAEAAAARNEKEQALKEARDARDRIYTDRTLMEEQFTRKLEGVHGNSNTLISTLLPQAQQQAQNQINTMMAMFEGRLSSAENSYQSRIDNLDRSYQQRMEAQADLFRSQMESSKQLANGQIQHLGLELQAARAEKALLMQQLDEARNRLMEQIQQLNSAKDPEAQMMKMGSMIETFKSLGFGGKEESDEPSGTGNPFFDGIMGNIGKLAEVVPHITGAITAKAQAEAQASRQSQQPQQMMMAPQQFAQPQQFQQQPQQQQMMAPQQQQPAPPQQQPAPRPRPVPKAVAKKKGKIKREELDKAVTYINAALSSNPNISPVDYANAAIAGVDNDMLRQLSRQRSDLVVNELETMGVLHGNVSTPEGKAFLCKLFDILRAKL